MRSMKANALAGIQLATVGVTLAIAAALPLSGAAAAVVARRMRNRH
jgi:hypothetical protein